MNSISDAELVRSAREGNREAYSELIRRYQKHIYALACALVADRDEAEDISQEAFLRAWLNLDMLSDPAKFAPWLRRIVFGVSIDWLRAFRPNLYRLENASADSELLSHPAAGEPADARFERLELQQRVWDAVSRLPSRYRLPLTMFHLDGLSHSRVAEALSVPASTVRSLVTRARQKLRPILSAYASEIFSAVEDVFDEQATRQVSMLHIVDGGSVAGTLRESSVPGEVMIYGDLFYEGPAPAGLSDEAWMETRARFHSDAGYVSLDEARKFGLECERTLHRSSEAEEVVLWTDHRLSDQLILLKVLDWLSRKRSRAARTSLISVGRYPAIDNFVALGQLNSDQLASLLDTRLQVTDAQFSLAQTAWAAFCSPDPRKLEKLSQSDTAPLPFLKTALHRHLQQFPSVENGLSRTEHQALSILQERGAISMTAAQLFVAVQRSEEALFMGNTSFYRLLIAMASAAHPVIEVADMTDLKLIEQNSAFETWTHSPVRIIETGLRVLNGQDDYVKLNGIDCWRGGVHLSGAESAWRWDKEASRLLATP